MMKSTFINYNSNKRMKIVYNLPNLLTISRIVVIPVIFLTIYIHSALWYLIAGLLFIVAAITDYLDGYLARSRNELSAFGRLLDPIADKLLVVSALVIIVANGLVDTISYIPVVVILCREILVSGLREFLSEVRVGLPVTRLAKWKTGFQMVALAVLLMAPALFFNILEGFWIFIGTVCLWAAGILTFITGYQYFQKSLDYIKAMEKAKKKAVAKTTSPTVPVAKTTSKAKSAVKKTAKPAAKKTVTKAKKSPTKKTTKKASAK